MMRKTVPLPVNRCSVVQKYRRTESTEGNADKHQENKAFDMIRNIQSHKEIMSNSKNRTKRNLSTVAQHTRKDI